MKTKTIKNFLRSKINTWIDSIADKQVQKLARKNTIVTGGSIASMLLREPIKDIDLYFRDAETALAIAEYYVEDFNKRNPDISNRLGGSAKAYVLYGERDLMYENDSVTLCSKSKLYDEFKNQSLLTRMIAGCAPDRIKIIVRSDGVASEDGSVLEVPFEDVFEVLEDADTIPAESLEDEVEDKKPEDKYRPIFLSSNAITLSDRIQLVIRFYGDSSEIHESFDFVHCTNYYDFGKNELVLNPEALECLLTKELRYRGSLYPLCSIIRTRKFIKRGFTINAGQYLKMCFQLSQLDLTDIDVLEDQLVGVDSAYFMALINGLRSKMEHDPSFKIEESYVASIIDKIF